MSTSSATIDIVEVVEQLSRHIDHHKQHVHRHEHNQGQDRQSFFSLVQQLHKLIVSMEIRDIDNIHIVYVLVLQLLIKELIIADKLTTGTSDNLNDDIAVEHLLWECWLMIANYPDFSEFNSNYRNSHVVDGDPIHRLTAIISHDIIEKAILKLCHLTWQPIQGLNVSVVLLGIQSLLHWIYQHHEAHRPSIRLLLGNNLLTVGFVRGRRGDCGRARHHVAPLLEVLDTIIVGLGHETNLNTGMELLRHVLMPLHEPDEMEEWRDQIPALQSYHSKLVKCIQDLIAVLQPIAHTSVRVAVFNQLLTYWPSSFQSNTPKELLLIAEIEQLIEIATPPEFTELLPAFLARISKSCGSIHDNFRVSQRCLQVFRNSKIIGLCGLSDQVSTRVIESLLPTLYHDGNLSWNPTVNKMTGAVLMKFQEINPVAFRASANRLCGNKTERPFSAPSSGTEPPSVNASVSSQPFEAKRAKLPPTSSPSEFAVPRAPIPRGGPISTGMMLPPRAGVSGATSSLPGTNSTMLMGQQGATWWGSKKGAPPVTVTGVAPWAAKGPALTNTTLTQPVSHHPQYTSEDISEQGIVRAKSSSTDAGLEKVNKFISECLPKDQLEREVENGPYENSWTRAQAAATPTLLPSLKFHDLVFGQDLGSGAFSLVRYAREINRNTTRSRWAEFAVKVISGSKITEQNYSLNVEREISILQVLCHPGISRLISSFRYKDSAYLVLEYAAKGDLHSAVVSQGPMSHSALRFVLGEIAAALVSVQDLGFVFIDLKPENILITAAGHIKLTDFGGTRACTTSAHSLLQDSRGLLSRLRNGDWREEVGSSEAANVVAGDVDGAVDAREEETSQTFADDNRWEGTPAYLSPEVLRGAITSPTILVDSWALGCVASFCLHGRPPFFGTANEVLNQVLGTFHQHVRFLEPQSLVTHSESTSENISLAREFIDGLLTIDADARCTVRDAASHRFLTHGTSFGDVDSVWNPFELHMHPPKVDIGGGTAGSGAKDDDLWKRRQLSTLWAPMPTEGTNAGSMSSTVPRNLRYTLTSIPELSENGSRFYSHRSRK